MKQRLPLSPWLGRGAGRNPPRRAACWSLLPRRGAVRGLALSTRRRHDPRRAAIDQQNNGEWGTTSPTYQSYQAEEATKGNRRILQSALDCDYNGVKFLTHEMCENTWKKCGEFQALCFPIHRRMKKKKMKVKMKNYYEMANISRLGTNLYTTGIKLFLVAFSELHKTILH